MRALGIRSKGAGFALLFQYLHERGCACELVTSYSEGVRRFAEEPFDIVLCNGEPGIETLLAAVEGSCASVYCAHVVENGRWWCPVIRNGRRCLGEPALRSGAFTSVLTTMLKQSEPAASAGRSGSLARPH